MEYIQTNVLQAILAAADKHPNAKISKLIKNVELERNSKNIVLLLMELSQHPEFAYDHSISLQYYLHMFQELPEETSFPDTGLLLLNSAIIYGKRVDEVHLSIEKLIISLINSDKSDDMKKNENPMFESVPKRGKKRSLEELNGPYEANMQIKRFKIISNDKRFDNVISHSNKNFFMGEGSDDNMENLSKTYKHPAIWQHSIIEDFDYDDESDSKKNYKLFTYHLEHRYNTLIPDINFKMYYKMKDFIDIKCRDSTNIELWPPLSHAYIEHYVNLENQILNKEGHKVQIAFCSEEVPKKSSTMNSDMLQEINYLFNSDQHQSFKGNHGLTVSKDNLILENISVNCISSTYDNQQKLDTDSGMELGCSSSIEMNEACSANENYCQLIGIGLNEITLHNDTSDDTAVEPGICFSSRTEVITDDTNKFANKTERKSQSDQVDLASIRVILPHLDDEGVFFSDLDERDQQMLSPTVVATDVFRCMKDKSNVIVIVDDEIKKMYNILEPKEQIFTLPVIESFGIPKLSYNLLKIDSKYFKKRRTFKLGSEFHLLIKARQKKQDREIKHTNQIRTWVRLDEDVIGVPLSPTISENGESDFYGFPDDTPNDKNRSLSRDSGISMQHIDNNLERDVSIDFPDDAIPISKTLDLKINELSEFKQNSVDKFSEKNIFSPIFLEVENSEKQQVQADMETNSDIVNNSGIECRDETDQISKTNENVTSALSKVQEWHTHLQPILAKSRDHHHFDVFELGSEIINQFDKCTEKNKVISFNHVMENKPSSFISRYFLSTLLLANQGNIRIETNKKNSEAPSELVDVQLKLLSKKRNIVSLEENAGFTTPTITVMRPLKEPILRNVRTLKPFPNAPKCEDHDSGISLSSM